MTMQYVLFHDPRGLIKKDLFFPINKNASQEDIQVILKAEVFAQRRERNLPTDDLFSKEELHINYAWVVEK